MRIITLNLNGIRSAAKKGFFSWFLTQDADILCVQELRAQAKETEIPDFCPPGYHTAFHYAEKKGYSGVGIYSRHQPLQITTGLGFESADNEGRYVAMDLGKVSIASLYMPSGTSGDLRQNIKFDFLTAYQKYLSALKKPFIICGDLNIAHRPIDLRNWRANQKNSGFLPEERAWMDQLFNEWGFIDAFRVINQNEHQYTWWSNRGKAYDKNVGWRIDYQVISPLLKTQVKTANIYKEMRFSDHAPLIIDYDIAL